MTIDLRDTLSVGSEPLSTGFVAHEDDTGCTPVVLIIGGGYAGAALTMRLLERRHSKLHIVIAEPRASLGRGQAYSTTETAQLMNGPAGNFSLYPDDPSHLARWVAKADGSRQNGDDAADRFIPRGLFGQYVEEQLARTIAAADTSVQISHWRCEVVKLRRNDGGGWRAWFRDGRELDTDLIVLATGVFPLARDPALTSFGQQWRLSTPWQPEKLDRLSRVQDILIVGASLSMVDTVASLESRGFCGRYHVISRRGHLIEPVRTAGEPIDILDPDDLPRTTRALLALVIAARRKLLAERRDWQVLPLSLRPFILPLWQGATAQERRRFIRHLKALWDVTAHRAAPPSFAAIEAARTEGRFHASAARLVSVLQHNNRIDVTLRPRGKQQTVTIAVDGIVDARGHQEHDWSRIRSPLVQDLLETGIVRRHESGFGIDATPDGQIIDHDSHQTGDLFAIGHPLRGVAWESSSLTEIGAQASALADRLCASLTLVENKFTESVAWSARHRMILKEESA